MKGHWQQALLESIQAEIIPSTIQSSSVFEGLRQCWAPLPGPQLLALESEADILFYGGAAGGGKTDLLIGAAVLNHHKAIIFRREYPQLREVIDRTKQVLGDGKLGNYNGNTSTFYLRDGRKVELAGVPHLQNVQRFQGRPHDYIGFDEITTFMREQFLFLIGWRRTTIPNQRTRVICTGNPPMDPTGIWVVDYWAPWLDPEHPNPAKPGELRWFATLGGQDVELDGPKPFKHEGGVIQPHSRTFIPASVEDNPYLMQTNYVQTLQGLPEPLRSRLLFGDFGLDADDDQWQVIPSAWVDAAMSRWDEVPPVPMLAMGVDVSRGGQDQAVLSPRHGSAWFGKQIVVEGKEVPDGQTLAALVVLYLENDAEVNLDIIGVGSSPYDFLVENGVKVNALNVATRSTATDKTGKFGFANLRSELYWKFREALDPDHGEDIALPRDVRLKADLCAARWKLSSRGIAVEPKDQIKQRLGRSPDRGDSLLYANARQSRAQARGW